MSKKRYSRNRRVNDNQRTAVAKRPSVDVSQTVAALVELSRHTTKDSYSNPGANLGVGQHNLMNMSEYPMTQ